MFAFTSPGLKVDTTYNTRRGPPTFHIHGQGHHLIGSLLPMPNNSPKFAHQFVHHPCRYPEKREEINWNRG